MKTLKSIFVVAVLLLCTVTIRAQEIFDAVKNNNLAQVKALIEKNISLVSIKDNAGNTLLHNSVIIGSVELTEYLLSKGADINGVNTMLDTPLHEAINNAHDQVAKLLIVSGADVQKQNTMGNSPLHVAAHKNRKAVAELLIERGADLESKQVAQMTPLNLLALMTDNVDLAKVLIEKGADVNTKNRNGNTPLVNAAQHGSDGMIDLLIMHNADFDTANNGATDLLITAAGRGSFGLFNYVMKKGGIVVFENGDGCKALMRSALSGGSLEIVKLLREKNIPLSFEPNVSGWTPLHRAAANNKPDMLEYLIKEGADINFRTKAGLSIYNIAEENGHNELLNLILKLGGNAESQKFPILTGLYLGQKPPGKMPERFAPDIFIYNHSTVTVSPDGKEMYWNSGPKFGEGPIMMTKIVDGKWIKPVEAPFSGKQYSKFDDCPFVSPDNKRVFFISMRPLGSRTDNKENIWYVERTTSGWSEPKPVSEEINAMKLHWQISVSKNGTLYFNGRDKEGSSIRYSRCVNGFYAKPENIGIDGMSPFIAPDESYLIFTKLVSNRPNPFICFKSKESKWNEPIDLQQYIGPGVCCIVSPDGKYLFKDSYWVDASFIEELRPKELNSQSAVMGQGKLGSNDNLVYTILYNNTSVSDSIIADHGFSCLIESGDHSCLFDAGRISDKFMTNVSKLGVNYSRINQVFISHFHGDHTGGLFDILAKCNQPTLYLPFSYPQTPSEPHTDKSDSDFNSLLGDLKPLVSEIIQKKESGEIGDKFHSTGMIEDQTYEQALIVPTSKGLIIITGCAHLGILKIVRHAKELMKQDVYFVMGGFHLIRTDSMQVKTIALELRKLTKYIGPCHCTGEKAQGIFKDIFKEDYINIQAGLKLKIGEGNL